MINSSGHFLSRSAIGGFLKLIPNPGMILYGGGPHAQVTFPVDDLKKTASEVPENEGQNALQYCTADGDPHLRKILLERDNPQGFNYNHGKQRSGGVLKGWRELSAKR